MSEPDSSIVKRSPRTLSEAEWVMIEEYGVRWAIESLNINGSELAEMYFTMASNAYELGDIKEADGFRSKAEMIVVQFSEDFDQKPQEQISRQAKEEVVQKEEIIDVLVKAEGPKNQQSRNVSKVVDQDSIDQQQSKVKFGKSSGLFLGIIFSLLGASIGTYFFTRSTETSKDPDLHLFCTNRANREARYDKLSDNEKDNAYERCMETTKLIIPSDEEIRSHLMPNLRNICWGYRQAYDNKKLDPLNRYSKEYFEMSSRIIQAERACNQSSISNARELYREMSDGLLWLSEKDELYIDLGVITFNEIKRRDQGTTFD